LGWMARQVDSFLVLLAWLTGDFRLRYRYDRFFRAGMMREIDRATDVIIAPMTLLRFFAMKAPALVSMHDIQQEYHPEFFPLWQRISRWAVYRLSAWRAARIQASSRYIGDCLVEKFSFVDPRKIIVIPESVDRERFSPAAPSEMPPELAGLAGRPF